MKKVENLTIQEIVSELLGNKKDEFMTSENLFTYESLSLLNNVISNLTPAKQRFALLILELYKKTKANKENCKIIQSSDDIFNICKDMAFLDHEIIRIIAINSRGAIIEYKDLFNGGYTNCLSDNRIIFKYLLDIKATSFIIVHNHPSGFKYPSRDDKTLTKSLLNFASFIDIRCLDHIIITGENDFYSFADEGEMKL